MDKYTSLNFDSIFRSSVILFYITVGNNWPIIMEVVHLVYLRVAWKHITINMLEFILLVITMLVYL